MFGLPDVLLYLAQHNPQKEYPHLCLPSTARHYEG
jgi:hypothetical protein